MTTLPFEIKLGILEHAVNSIIKTATDTSDFCLGRTVLKSPDFNSPHAIYRRTTIRQAWSQISNILQALPELHAEVPRMIPSAIKLEILQYEINAIITIVTDESELCIERSSLNGLVTHSKQFENRRACIQRAWPVVLNLLEAFPELHAEVPKILSRLVWQYERRLYVMLPIFHLSCLSVSNGRAERDTMLRQKFVLELRPMVAEGIRLRAVMYSKSLGKTTGQ